MSTGSTSANCTDDVPSQIGPWTEHLRRHQRATHADYALQEQILNVSALKWYSAMSHAALRSAGLGVVSN